MEAGEWGLRFIPLPPFPCQPAAWLSAIGGNEAGETLAKEWRQGNGVCVSFLCLHSLASPQHGSRLSVAMRLGRHWQRNGGRGMGVAFHSFASIPLPARSMALGYRWQ